MVKLLQVLMLCYSCLWRLINQKIKNRFLNLLATHKNGCCFYVTTVQCNREVALDAFYKQMKYLPTKIGWVASGCSLATQAIAELTHFYNITQVKVTLRWLYNIFIPADFFLPKLSCISSSPALRNRMRYR